MSARLCSLLAVLAIAVLAVANPTVKVELSEIGASVSFVKATYRHRSDSTEFVYSVSTGASDLSHWVLSPGCDLPLYQPDDQDWLPFGVDPSTGAAGYEALGQDASQTKEITIIFKGDVSLTATEAVQYTVKSGLKYAQAHVRGPQCSGGSIKTVGRCANITDIQIACPSSAQPGSYGQTSVDIESVNGRCPNEHDYIVHYNFEHGDGSCEQCEQIQHVVDKTAPTIYGVEDAYIQKSCNDPAPAVPSNVFANDTCQDGDIIPNYCEKRNNGSCPNNYFLVRTWTATDECGNSKCVTQTIAYLDETAPSFSGLPDDDEVECNVTAGPVNLTDSVTVSDHGCDCFLNPSKPITYTEAKYPGECPNTYEVVRTWSATDCCNNVAKATRKFKVVDTTLPVLVLKNESLKANDTFQCDAVPEAYEVVAADNCMANAPVVTHTDKNHTGACIGAYTIERQYTACDDCGNIGKLTTWWVIDDSIPPFWTSKPTNASNECGAHGQVTAPVAQDSCSPIKNNTITYNDTIPGDCPNEFTIVHVWTAYDDCGNSVTHSYQEVVYDTTPVKIDPASIPDYGPFSCYEDVPSLEESKKNIKPLDCVGSHCACEQTYNVTAVEYNVSKTCENRMEIVRVYTFTDKCGNTDSVNKTIIVNDQTGPILYGDAPDETVLCNQVSIEPTVTSCDVCDLCDCENDVSCRSPVAPIVANGTVTCDYAYTYTRNWTATDDCGNPTTKIQTITVINPDVPRFVNPPGDETVQCGGVPVKQNLTAVMNCTSVTVDNSIPDETSGEVCDGDYKIIRKWKATDDTCGKVTWYNQTITVIDTTDPVITGDIQDEDVPCGEIPPPPAVCASDNCVGLSLKYSEVRNNFSDCAADPSQFVYELIRTWNATDKCGNSVTRTQRIRVHDRVNPTVGSQENLSFNCTDVTIPDPPTFDDACTEATLDPFHYRVNNSECDESYVLYRNYRVSDECGNTVWLNYTITVTDNQAPTFEVPADNKYECVPVREPATNLDDNCDDEVAFSADSPVEVNSTKCLNEYNITRTWTATDDCGQPTVKSQLIQVYNPNNPEFNSSLPGDKDYQCEQDIPTQLFAFDGCGNPIDVDEQFSNETHGCVHRITFNRTYVAIDDCGLSVTHTQIVRVNDTGKPGLSGVPANTTAKCAPLPPASVCATDNCDGVTINYTQQIIPYTDNPCEHRYTVIRTWTATDVCGNTHSESQWIEVNDDVVPTFDEEPPADQYVNCSHVAPEKPTATDNCKNVTVTDYSYRVNGSCEQNYEWHVAFEARDLCGNTAWYNYTIFVSDLHAPIITNWIGDVSDQNFTCGEEPAVPEPVVSDNCNTGKWERLDDIRTNTTICDDIYTVVRRWRIYDDCGNDYIVNQTISGIHPIPPEFTLHPLDEDVESCTGTPTPVDPTAKDMCERPLIPGYTTKNLSRPDLCPYSFDEFRNWTATQCGLSSSVTQTIRWRDTVDPVFTEPSDKIEPNKCEFPDPTDPAASDTCDPNPTVRGPRKEVENETCKYRKVHKFYWNATDDCDNVGFADQTITYTWTTKPTLSSKPTFTGPYECVPPTRPNITAVDGCGLNLTVDFVETRVNTSCEYEYQLTWAWNTTDDCGLTDEWSQTFWVVNNKKPTLTPVQKELVAECGFIPEPVTVTGTPGCFGKVNVTVKDEIIEGQSCCNYTIIRTWTGVDECGLNDTVSQTITVVDTIPPRLHGVPADKSVPCPWTPEEVNVTGEEPPLAVGYCVNEEVSVDPACATPAPLSFVVGGNELSVTGTTFVEYLNGQAFFDIAVSNGSASGFGEIELGGLKYLNEFSPAYTPDAELNADCYGNNATQVSFNEWSYYTQAVGWLYFNGVNYTLVEDSSKPSQVGTGANGQSTEYGASLYLLESGNAVRLRLDFTGNGFGSCSIDESEWPELKCGEPIVVNVTNTTIPGGCDQEYTFIRTWCAFDKVGNKVCANQTVTVYDDADPIISGLPNEVIHANCSGPIPPPEVPDVSDCDPNVVVTNRTNKIPSGVCEGRYILQYIYNATDDCGNEASTYYEVHVDDTEDPVISGVPNTTVHLQCNDSHAPVIATASDNCGINATTYPILGDYVDEEGTQQCDQSFTRTYVYTAEDDCGNPTVAEYTISVRDDNKPDVVNVPSNDTKECKDPFPGHSADAVDICDSDPFLNVSVQWFNDSTCPGKYAAQRTFQAKDACGNLSPVYYQWIQWRDTQKPTFNGPLPQNATAQCGQTVTVPTITANDACTGPITPVMTNWTTGENCANKVYWYKWTITDCSGNSDEFVWTVTVSDTVNPTITSAGDDVNAANCTIPLPPAVCAQDNCPGVTLDYEETKICTDPLHSCEGANPCARYRLNRTWVATDNCGNKNSTSYNVHVNDVFAPSCTWTAPPATVPCNETVTVNPPVCSDDCSGVIIDPFTSESDSSCIKKGVKNYAYRVSDYCGNHVWFNATVTFVDNFAPVISGDFADENVTCPNAIPSYTPTVSDVCDLTVQLGTPEESETENPLCTPLKTVVRTYWAKDACGNWAQNKTKTYRVIDETAPTFDQAMPANVTVNCSAIPPMPENFTATDSCLGKVPVFDDSYEIPGDCANNYQIVRTWNASDCAGNVARHVQVITVVDQINPTITFTPPLADREEDCKGDFSVPTACASDNCDGVNITYSGKKDKPNPSCDKYTINRTWYATDACGNQSPVYQYTITVNDTVGPDCPELFDGEATCNAPNASDPTAPTCTDHCSTVSYDSFPDKTNGNCLDNYLKHFNFLAYDGCGNPTWRNVTINVTDQAAPWFVDPPADVTINCTEAANYPVPTVEADDLCDPNPVPQFVPISNGFEEGKCGNYTIVRRWTLKDRCGNEAANHTQTITVVDIEPPRFLGTLPTNKSLPCDQTEEQPVLTAEDNCGIPTVANFSTEVERHCDGNYTVEWKWIATDLCGLTTEHKAYITYYDNVKPTMTAVDPVVNYTCGNVAKPPQVCCNDECSSLSLNFSVTRVNGSCDSRYTLYRKWICTDDCGNYETREQTVNVGDLTPPVFDLPLPETPINAECAPDAAPNVTATDDCTGKTIAQLNITKIDGGCDANYTLIRTYTAYDQCGVASQFNQTVEVRDTKPPTTCGGFECRLKYSYGQFLQIPQITVPNEYFCANDTCSSVNITLISCVSNQDVVLNATTTLPGFTNQCDYKPDQDTLYISGLIDTTDPLGRMYVITAVIMDQCGHAVTTTREVFIPLDANSFVLRNITDHASDECTSIPIDCPDSCPCQTVDHYCDDTQNIDQGILEFDGFSTDGEYTTYNWSLVATVRPTRIAIGLDLTKIQFISASPDTNVRIGEVDGSLLTGVFWLSTHVTTDTVYTITVKGTVEEDDLVPYQTGGLQTRQDDVPSVCNPFQPINGIVNVDVTPAAEYTGFVQIIGAFGGEARNLSVPLKDVIVNLINNSTRQILASVMTDESGAYSFPGWTADPEHHVILSSTDGFLRPGRSSNIFLMPQTTNAFLDDKWGVSQPAGANVNFGLLLRPDAQPVYNRPLSATGFEGNSYLAPFWRYQYTPSIVFSKKAEFPSAVLTAWAIAADTAAPCAQSGFDEPAATLKHQLRAAALNLASGRGPFDPYREAAAWFVAYADLACGFESTATDAVIALDLVKMINQADDLD